MTFSKNKNKKKNQKNSFVTVLLAWNAKNVEDSLVLEKVPYDIPSVKWSVKGRLVWRIHLCTYQTFFCALPQPCKCPVEDLKQLEHCIKLVVEGWILNAITHFTLRAKTIWSQDIDASLRKPWFQDYSLFLASINSGVLFQFRQFIDQDITKNYRHDDVLVNIGRVALACTLLLSFPLLIFPCRAVINRVWKINTVEYEEPDTQAFLFLL